jgi:WD40 repeat protein
VIAADRVYSGSADNTIRVWSSLDGRCMHVMAGYSAWASSTVVHDGLVFCGVQGNGITVVRSDGQTLHTLTGHTGHVFALLVHGKILYSGGADGKVRACSRASAQRMQSSLDP